VFGGIQRGTANCFFVPVEKRDTATLLPLTERWILPKTTIISDETKAYSRLKKHKYKYKHLTVNHKRGYVNPMTSACTNGIESRWQHVKASLATYNRLKRFLKYILQNICIV